MAHSPTGPSGSKRWMSCTASVRLIQRLREAGDIPPDNTSRDAEEGTTAHELAAMLLRGVPDETVSAMAGTTLAGISITTEMVEYVQGYRDYVVSIKDKAEDAMLFVEQEFSLFYDPSSKGTADAVVWLPTEGTLHVIDLKYGVGVKVEAAGNPQTRIYARSATEELSDLMGVPEHVVLHIYQPRYREGSNIDHETLKYHDLVTWCLDVKDAYECIQKGEYTQFAPSDEACRFCPAAPCPGQTSATVDLFDDILDTAEVSIESMDNDIDAKIETVDPEDLSRFMASKKSMEAFFKAVEARCFYLAGQGRLPGWKLVPGRSSRNWTDEEAAEKWLVRRLTKACAFEHKLLSVAKAEKALGKELSPRNEKAFQALINKSEGNPTLAPESDKRAELPRIEALFDDLNSNDLLE